MTKQKVIGTLIPLSALATRKSLKTKQNGTIEDGLLFIDWLHKTGQHAWQLLPLHQTQLIPGSTNRHLPSPYKSYGIGLDPRFLPDSYKNLQPNELDLELFLKQHADWINDYALFCSLRDHYGTDDWTTWQEDIKSRNTDALKLWQKKLAPQIEQHILTQWQLDLAYTDLHAKANQHTITLIGDIAYYLSLRSPLVWQYQHAFQINPDGSLPRVSGVPDEPHSMFGRQIWKHPLYRWDGNNGNNTVIKLWKIRLNYIHHLFDYVRLDHANGFFLYGSIDLQNEANDEIIKGPGMAVFEPLIRYCKEIGNHIIAEDAGEDLHDLRQALTAYNTPGIRVLRCGIDIKRHEVNTEYASPNSYPVKSVAYTTTHDTETLMGLLSMLSVEQKKLFADKAGVVYSDSNQTLITRLRRAVLNSPSQFVIIPMQDWLLTTERINIPGTEREENDLNWQYRLSLPIEELPVDIIN